MRSRAVLHVVTMTGPAELLVGLFSMIEYAGSDQREQGVVKTIAKLVVRPEDVLDAEEICVMEQSEGPTQGVGCRVPVGPIVKVVSK